MKIISHRGNLKGSDLTTENTPKQIKLAIEKGFDVEIDVRVISNKIYIGHDKPEHKVSYKFISKYSLNLWIHCKNLDAFSFFKERNESVFCNYNYFWHDTDIITITSRGIPWCYPGTYLPNGITVHCGPDWTDAVKKNPKILGVCTDYPLT